MITLVDIWSDAKKRIAHDCAEVYDMVLSIGREVQREIERYYVGDANQAVKEGSLNPSLPYVVMSKDLVFISAVYAERPSFSQATSTSSQRDPLTFVTLTKLYRYPNLFVRSTSSPTHYTRKLKADENAWEVALYPLAALNPPTSTDFAITYHRHFKYLSAIDSANFVTDSLADVVEAGLVYKILTLLGAPESEIAIHQQTYYTKLQALQEERILGDVAPGRVRGRSVDAMESLSVVADPFGG